MDVTICPGPLRGTVRVPVSKSEAHRALICAALCPEGTAVVCPDPAADVLATAQGLWALGTGMEYQNGKFYVNQILPSRTALIDCGESGSTLRFLLPLAAALGTETEFRCRGRLAERPMQPLLELLCANGCAVQRSPEGWCLTGKLEPGDYTLDASVSSQFLSGILMALPLLPGSSVRLNGELASKDYVNLTAEVLSRFGVEISCPEGVYTSAGRLQSPGEYLPEGDWSAAAFWLTANALGSTLRVEGLAPDSVQGDREVTGLIDAVRSGSAVIDAGDVPDLVPPLAVLAAVTPGETCFTNAARLRQKESDRLAALTALLNGLGGECEETADGLRIRGVTSLRGGSADGFGDHRIAMSAAIAATVCDGSVTLRGMECVNKSYPAFWSEFERLGGIMR